MPSGTLQSLIAVVGNIIGLLASIFSTLAFVVFFYGLVTFILNAGNQEKIKEGKNIMTWGIVALFILATIWGIIGILQRTVGNTRGPGRVDIVLPAL